MSVSLKAIGVRAVIIVTLHCRVLKGKESVAAMRVRVISGLALRINSGTGGANNNRQRRIYTAETSFSRRLTSKYQGRYSVLS